MNKKPARVICAAPLANDWIEKQEMEEDPIVYAESKKKYSEFQQEVLENIQKNNRKQTLLKIVIIVLLTLGILRLLLSKC